MRADCSEQTVKGVNDEKQRAYRSERAWVVGDDTTASDSCACKEQAKENATKCVAGTLQR